MSDMHEAEERVTWRSASVLSETYRWLRNDSVRMVCGVARTGRCAVVVHDGDAYGVLVGSETRIIGLAMGMAYFAARDLAQNALRATRAELASRFVTPAEAVRVIGADVSYHVEGGASLPVAVARTRQRFGLPEAAASDVVEAYEAHVARFQAP